MIFAVAVVLLGAGPFALGRSKQPSAPPPFVATRVRRVTLESSVVPPSVVQRAAVKRNQQGVVACPEASLPVVRLRPILGRLIRIPHLSKPASSTVLVVSGCERRCDLASVVNHVHSAVNCKGRHQRSV